MFALKCLAGCIVWLSIIGIIAFFAGAGIIFLYNAGILTPLANYQSYLGIPTVSSTYSSYYDIFGYICLGLSALFLLVTLCCCSRIRLAVAVCKAAGQFVSGVCLVVIVPIFQTLITLCLWAACLVVMVYLVSSTSFVYRGDIFTNVADYAD
jgi:hypothetical protein